MPSLFDAMSTAVSGLTAQGLAMSNISNNIANAQTTGFKGTSTSFADLVAQSGIAGRGNGEGAFAVSTTDVTTEGTLAQASSGTDLAISGNGFFAVQTGQVGTNGTVTFNNTTQYTRRGDFALNSAGFLVNGVGAYLDGYAVDQTTGVANTAALVPVQVPNTINAPVPTSSATLDANLPANAPTGTALSPTTLQVFDALGNAHDINLTWTPNGAGSWTADMQIPGAVGGFNHNLDLTFGTSGAGINPGTLQTLADGGGGAFTPSPSGSGAPATVQFQVNFGSGPQTITLNLGTYNTATGLTQFSASNTEVSVSSTSQNGVPQGIFQSLSIDTSGNLTVNYSNGQTATLYQLPVAQFENPDGLSASTGSLWSPTSTSGVAVLNGAGLNGAGSIQSGELEDSNVDLTNEFTKMIQTQQVYSANSRSITTANNMLADLLAIIHS
jgi:flagellar hook protein FlgE